MVIFLTGATGFIGRHLASALRAAGHRVIEARRRVSDPALHVAADFTRDLNASDWIPRLANVDCVINAVGILRERGDQTFDRIHTQAPRALFEACVHAGVSRVIQVSALGADTGASGYFRSKHAADEVLASLPLDWTIVQPSVVYGPGGTSARLFTLLASLPVIPLPGRGTQSIQPIHIDDVTAAIVALVSQSDPHSRARVALVGPRKLELREFLTQLRSAIGLRRTRRFGVPMPLMRLMASIAQWLPRSLLDRETLAMLEAGYTADPSVTHSLLGRKPREVSAFVEPRYRDATRQQAQLTWLLPLLRVCIAAVWIWTGIVSLGLYPVEESYALLARVGVDAAFAPLLLYGAALLDFAFGIATLALSRRRLLWLAQMALIVGYTAIITIKLPEFWLHPYGPILKNLPMLVGIYMLYVLEGNEVTRDG
ncbi:MAG: NAD(P)H-binding protein [Xanthomonadaceae bacterium]|nr:NAD(P)H-binding protein [Xanthomonadaceae bacterium]